MKLLIAEDDMTSRLILDSILKKWGFATSLACNGKEAWDTMNSKTAPKIAILDWEMPEMSGIEVCKKIRGIDTSNPPYIIVLTSKEEKKDIVKALDAGANDFISKPYDNEELKARINVGKRMVELQAELAIAHKALHRKAMTDPLTDIYNRRAIMELIEKEMARAKRNKTCLQIGMCDLDFFKKINDVYGHQTGDEVLIAFTNLVKKKLRSSDYLGRYGGEEFLVVLPDSKASGQQTIFDRICKFVGENKISTEKGEISITVSIGAAMYSGGDKDIDSLLEAADKALYNAKSNGRDQAVCV